MPNICVFTAQYLFKLMKIQGLFTPGVSQSALLGRSC